MNDTKPIRVQVAVYNILTAEFIAENYEMADEMMAAYFRLKYSRGLPMGGACLSSADSRRMWDVPVGSVIPGVE